MQLLPFWRRLADSIFVRNALWSFVGQFSRLVIQAVYFILIARHLGPNEYGAFVAVTAAAAIAGPFVGLGYGNLLIKNVSRDHSCFAAYWGNGLLLTVASGSFLTITLVSLSHLLLPSGIGQLMITLVAASDLIFMKITELAGYSFQARENLRNTAGLNVVTSLSRLVGLLVLLSVSARPTAANWAFVYFATGLGTAILSLTWIGLRYGRGQVALSRIKPELSEGLYFSVSASAFTIYTDIDKAMLANLATLDAAGIYAAAYRLIDIGFIPVRSILSAAYAGMFRHGCSGLAGTLQYAKRLMLRIAWYPLLASTLLIACAALVPDVLGRDYIRTTEALRWLAVIPLLKTLQFFAADALTGAGFQKIRTIAQLGSAGLNVGLNLWLIPVYSWRGAAWSSLASDSILALALWACATLLQRQGAQSRRSKEEAPAAC